MNKTLNRFLQACLDLKAEMRLAYLPPLMVYLAAGISGLTAIVGTFFVKDYLGLSAEFLASLGFWAMLPWSLKLPLGHLVDIVWRHKFLLVYAGAALIAVSLLIMLGLLSDRAALSAVFPAETWYVISTVLAPLGYVVQDVVADAMTVEAVPRVDAEGQPVAEGRRRVMNATLQTLGRIAIIGGTLLVAAINVVLFRDVENLAETEKLAVYQEIYRLALIIPLVSVVGVMLAEYLKRKMERSLAAQGYSPAEIHTLTTHQEHPPQANPWILGGGLVFGLVSISVGMQQMAYGQELIFAVSLAIILLLMGQILREMETEARQVLLGTALLIFVFRAVPGPGPGSGWWMIDELGFDQSFMARLSLVSSGATLLGLFWFRRFMAERPMTTIILVLTLAGTVLSLPTIGLFYGLHHWTASHTGGLVDARFIAIMDTALESPLGQVAMVPMLAWIAQSAPPHLKATFFAVMASFTNLSLVLGQLATKYLNQVYTVSREIRDTASGIVTVAADYHALGHLLIITTLLGLVLPLLAIGLIRRLRLRCV